MIVMIIHSNNNVNYNNNDINYYYNNIVLIIIGQVQTPGARETVTAFLLSL